MGNSVLVEKKLTQQIWEALEQERDKRGVKLQTIWGWPGAPSETTWYNWRNGANYKPRSRKTVVEAWKALNCDEEEAEKNTAVLYNKAHPISAVVGSQKAGYFIEPPKTQHQNQYELDSDAAIRGLPAITEGLPKNANLLEIDNTLAVIEDVAVRRRLFLRPVYWNNICRGGYAERPLLRRKIMQEFEGFLADAEGQIAALQVPVFWIGGRSGDGKSVFLMQLCQVVKQAHPARPVVLFDTPDALLNWVETVVLAGTQQSDVPLLIAVVDDLHKVSDWERTWGILERAATQECRIVIVTCGPTPERALFCEEPRLANAVALKKSDVTKIDTDDAKVIADHLGIELEAVADGAPTLVEQVFLKMAGEASIDTFAQSLKDRVDLRVQRDDLLEQLTAMAWLDLPLPRLLVSHDEAEWLEVLAGETQLHISVGLDGFYFGHPAIARPIFEALSRNGAKTPTLTTRIARVFNPILGKLESSMAITRILRQMEARFRGDAEINMAVLLDYFFREATGSLVKAATAVFLIHHLTQNKQQVGQELRKIARAFRGNNSCDPQIRAYLARNLALTSDAEEVDLRAASQLVDDAEVGRYMGTFLRGISRPAFRTTGITHRNIEKAVRWSNAYGTEQILAQDVITGFLSCFPNDNRIRAAARDLVRSALDQNELSPTLLGQVAKSMEDEMEPELRHWLTKFRKSVVARNVLIPLLKKPGTKWNEFALENLKSVNTNDPKWLSAVTALLPHIQSAALADQAIQIARVHVDASFRDQSVNGFFKDLAGLAATTDAEDMVCKRLNVLWQPEVLKEAEGERQACILFGEAWGKIAARDAGSLDRVGYIFNRVLEMERDAANNGLSKARKKLLGALRHSAGCILKWVDHAPFAAQSALEFLDEFPDDELSGLAAALLVRFDSILISQDNADLKSELHNRHASLIEACWRWVDDPNCKDRNVKIRCSEALIETCWETKEQAVKDLVRSFWYPSPRFEAYNVLQFWLRDPPCREEAWNFLLDQSFSIGTYDKLRSKIVARNLGLTFDKLRDEGLSQNAHNYLLRLLQAGVGNYEVNPSSAWAALQQRENWPKEAEPALWRGILHSALNGFTLRKSEYWSEFDAWQAINRDPTCEDIITEAGIAVAI